MVILKDMPRGGHEQVVFCRDKSVGLRAIIAIHSTVLGPALGGVRMWPYKSAEEALRDVLQRLFRRGVRPHADPAQSRTQDRAVDRDDRAQSHRVVLAEHDLLVAASLHVFQDIHFTVTLGVSARVYSTIHVGRTVAPMRDATGLAGLTISGLLGRLPP